MTLNRQTSLRLAGDLLAGLDWHTRRRGVTRSALIREALAAWLIEHPPGKRPPPPRGQGHTIARQVPACSRCGRAVRGPLALDAARLDPVEISRVTRWACGLCATYQETRHELACKLAEAGDVSVDSAGALWTENGLAAIKSAGHQLTLPAGYPRQ